MSNTTNPTVQVEAGRRGGWTLSGRSTQPDGSPIIQPRRLNGADPSVVARARVESVPRRYPLRQVDRVERTLVEASRSS